MPLKRLRSDVLYFQTVKHKLLLLERCGLGALGVLHERTTTRQHFVLLWISSYTTVTQMPYLNFPSPVSVSDGSNGSNFAYRRSTC
jgi:hypothetical protein